MYFGLSRDETANANNNPVFSGICTTVNMHFDVDEVFSG